jgi:predicted small lipoprotein YifL
MLLLALLAALGGSLAACGRYGPPVRAEEYRIKDEEKAKAAKQRGEQSPQERNEPIPAAP